MFRFIHGEKGSALVLVALAMVVLLGFTALAIDVGYVYFRKSQLMSMADSASLAGALAMRDAIKGNNDVRETVKAAVLNNLSANGFKEELTDQDFVLATEVGSEFNKVYILLDDKQVHVNLELPENWIFANVLSMSTGNVLASPNIRGLARSEVVSVLGEGFPGHAIISFNQEEGGVVRISGNVNIDSDEQISVHSNRDIEVDGGAAEATGNADPVASYLGEDIGTHTESFYTGGLNETDEVLESPFTDIIYDEDGSYAINSYEDLRDAFPGAASVMFVKMNDPNNPDPDLDLNSVQYDPDFDNPDPELDLTDTIWLPGGEAPPHTINLTHPADSGIRVVYIDGNVHRAGGNRNHRIETNGGLVIVAGYLDITGNCTFFVDGILYATGYLRVGGEPSITGALWSEEMVWFHGDAESFAYSELDPDLYSGESFSLMLVR